jgi:hypothetical protein
VYPGGGTDIPLDDGCLYSVEEAVHRPSSMGVERVFVLIDVIVFEAVP